jgi:hypothetical protein
MVRTDSSGGNSRWQSSLAPVGCRRKEQAYQENELTGRAIAQRFAQPLRTFARRSGVAAAIARNSSAAGNCAGWSGGCRGAKKRAFIRAGAVHKPQLQNSRD